jgi:hypothetical protein
MKKTLHLKYHGRILDHLGIQMYQSPVAALAELVANAWDADAKHVRISLPKKLDAKAEIVIKDDGTGMTFEDCQNFYLNVGWGRRADNPNQTSKGGRPILGRKGIGKFAGFGIAKLVRIATVSQQTGEKTTFEMNLQKLRGEKYVEQDPASIEAEYLPASTPRVKEHGSIVCLRDLSMSRLISPNQFSKSMARRFLLHETQADFKISINDRRLPGSYDFSGVQYVFPRDYEDQEKPSGLKAVDAAGWGTETIAGRDIRWRFVFYKDTIDEEELRGIAVFAKGKLCQAPFLFNLAGGLGGQAGVEYLAGQVQADYLDSLPIDVIAPERQRVNWEFPETAPLLDWGASRVKALLRIWHDRRGEERRKQLELKLAGFSTRLDALPKRESATVKTALRKIGAISSISRQKYEEIGTAILTAWEQGRLRGLIDEISKSDLLASDELLELLGEAQILAALNVAEAVRTKLDAIRGLQRLIEIKELENAVRDYIAKDPWLIHPRWETFKVEKTVAWILKKAAGDVGLSADKFRGRVDLALRSGGHLLVVEFVRPGKRVDWDHLSRCRRYVLKIRDIIAGETQLGIEQVTGLVVADQLDSAGDVKQELIELHKSDISAFSWPTLLSEAGKAWKDFLDILVDRVPGDARMKALRATTTKKHKKR